MDEKYFLYFKEVEFCRHAQQAVRECGPVTDLCPRFFIKLYGITGPVVANLLWGDPLSITTGLVRFTRAGKEP